MDRVRHPRGGDRHRHVVVAGKRQGIPDVFEQNVSVVLFGHWHQPSQFMLHDGTICVVNGSLIGSESFAQNGIGFFNSMPAQVMFESVPGFPVGDFRIVQLRDADNNEALDKIINVPGIEHGGLVDF